MLGGDSTDIMEKILCKQKQQNQHDFFSPFRCTFNELFCVNLFVFP